MSLDRREFVKKTFLAGCAMGAGSLFSSCNGITRGITRKDLEPSGREFEPVAGLDDRIGEILYYASLAPSGHNSQPWYVRIVNEEELIIGAEPRHRLPAVDPNNREALLSIGAFAENLSIAASAAGYDAQMDVIAENAFDEDIIKVSMKMADTGKYPLSRLKTRRKVKSNILPTELKSDDVRFLSEPMQDHLFYFPRGSEHAKCIVEGAIEAFRAQAYRDDAQRELAEWIRFSNKDAREHRNGITIEGMEIGGLAGLYVRNFMGKDDVMKKSFREQGIAGVAEDAQMGGGWLVITSKGNGVADLIETGRRIERMWLSARERMIAIHPMNQMLEEEAWRNEIASQHDSGMIPQFIIRVGYLDTYPDPVSLRRPVSWFLRT